MTDNRIVELIYKIASGRQTYRSLLTLIGPIFFFGIIALFILASIKTDGLLGFPKFLDNPTKNVISIPLMSVGITLIAWSGLNFRKAAGTPVPFNPPKTVVTRGPYAFSRNPMLTGLFILLLGFGIWLSTLSLIVIYLPLFILLNYLELKYVEEPELKKRLGSRYEEYLQVTPMFFPWTRKQHSK